MDNGIVGTSTVTQIAILVRDVETASEAYARFLGCEKPEWILTDAYESAQTEHRGKPSVARAKLAFFDIGPNLRLELIEPDENPSIWREDLDKYGEGFHHIGLDIKGMPDKIERLEKAGFPLVQRAEYPGGRYAYHNSRDELKLVVELLENDESV